MVTPNRGVCRWPASKAEHWVGWVATLHQARSVRQVPWQIAGTGQVRAKRSAFATFRCNVRARLVLSTGVKFALSPVPARLGAGDRRSIGFRAYFCAPLWFAGIRRSAILVACGPVDECSRTRSTMPHIADGRTVRTHRRCCGCLPTGHSGCPGLLLAAALRRLSG